MQLFTGLEYLKIDIANAAGKDKLLFSERLEWFEENIPDTVLTMDNLELKQFIETFEEPDSVELMFTGLLAYQDYFYKRPSGYRCQLDAICSGASLMSALTADEKGLDHTGLVSDRRGDLYTAVYKRFKELCNIVLPVEPKRQVFKDLVMQMLYGSKSIIEKTARFLTGTDEVKSFQLTKEQLALVNEVKELLVESISLECNGAFQLQQLLVDTWDNTVTRHSWIYPDGFNAVMPNRVEKHFKHTIRDGEDTLEIPYTLKVESASDKRVSNCANMVHGIDAMLVREMVRRCMFTFDINQVMHYLHQVPENVYESVEPNSKLEELVTLYELSGFVSVRVCDHIHSLQDACKLPKSMIIKLLDILEKMSKHGYFEVGCIHDCYFSLPNNMNFIRYWYKEMLADICESNMLDFMYNQIHVKQQINTTESITKEHRKEVANKIRNSNYGLS